VQPQINTFTDANGDGLIDIEGELRPTIEQFIANLPSFVPQGEASYQTAEVLAEFGIPALLVHGELDGWVPLRSAEAIAAVAPETVTLMAYPSLGHALSPVESALFDRFGVMDAQVIADIAAWVLGED
jgi:pimeloyl-ACP methyl ester carboxylesterase